MENDTKDKSSNLLINTFNTKEAGEKAYNLLIDQGYSKDDIYLVMSDDTRDKYFSKGEMPEHNIEDIKDGAGAGSMIGTGLGALAGAILAIGTSVTLPIVGMVISGPLLAALAGAGVGNLAGGVAGGLIASGIPQAHAKEYEEAIKNGEILVGVKAKDEEAYKKLKEQWDRL